MKQKALLVLEAIERETEPFVISDVDVRFYNFSPEDLSREMDPKTGVSWDLLAQPDDGTFCAGFMFIRPNLANLELFRLVLGGISEYKSDQESLNSFALPRLGNLVKASLLPPEKYWTVGPGWAGGEPPSGLAVHHANWMIGIDNKLNLLAEILAKHNLQNASRCGTMPGIDSSR